MPRVPTAEAAAAKFARVAPTRQQDYDQGVKDPSVDWAAAAAAAKPSWEEGIAQAQQRNAYAKGVNDAGTQKWRDKTTKVGSPRWAGGIRDAEGDYRDAMTPVLATIERTPLPPKGPRGDPRNYARVAAIGDALTKMRKGQ